MVTIEVHVQLGCLGVSIDVFDRISFRVGYIITPIIIALVFVRGLFLDIVFLLFFYGCMGVGLNFSFVVGLPFFFALR